MLRKPHRLASLCLSRVKMEICLPWHILILIDLLWAYEFVSSYISPIQDDLTKSMRLNLILCLSSGFIILLKCNLQPQQSQLSQLCSFWKGCLCNGVGKERKRKGGRRRRWCWTPQLELELFLWKHIIHKWEITWISELLCQFLNRQS